MSKPLPALFSSSQSDSPTVFHVHTVPRRLSLPRLTFRFDAGEIALSKGLLQLLEAETCRQVHFVTHKGHAYLSKADKNGYWLNLRTRHGSGVCSAEISASNFVRESMRELKHGPGEVIAFPVATHQVSAAELGLDPVKYPYPFYRIVTDQKTVK